MKATEVLASQACVIYLIEDNPDHAEIVRRYLLRGREQKYQLRVFETLEAGLDSMRNEHVDALLLDLSLPDSPIDETLERVTSGFPDLPVVVLTSLSDLELAAETVKRGAQDFLVKSELHPELLVRAITYAIERKQYSVALVRSNAELQRFASVIAHEIRSPMAVVQSCLQMIRRRCDPSQAQETLEIIEATEIRLQQLSALVHDLLSFAYAEPASNFRAFDSGKVCQEAISMLSQEVLKHRAIIRCHNLPIIDGDPALLRQVFQNLIVNALKYCSVQPEIEISCENKAESWVFSVKDNGNGIEPEDASRIFDIFKRVEGKKQLSGTGIGLSLSRRVIEHHKGRIWVESDGSTGSTFYFEIPKSPASVNHPCAFQ